VNNADLRDEEPATARRPPGAATSDPPPASSRDATQQAAEAPGRTCDQSAFTPRRATSRRGASRVTTGARVVGAALHAAALEPTCAPCAAPAPNIAAIMIAIATLSVLIAIPPSTGSALGDTPAYYFTHELRHWCVGMSTTRRRFRSMSASIRRRGRSAGIEP
jgi:hypothetical protein